MSLFSKLAGTITAVFQVGGPTGPKLKNNAANFDARNASDSAYINVRGADPSVANDLVTLGYLQTNESSLIDLLLSNDPVRAPNLSVGNPATYTLTYSGSKVTQEAWNGIGVGTPLIKLIAYTYTGIQLTQEVRTVYAADGVTVTGQLTIVYTYTGSKATSATYTRNV